MSFVKKFPVIVQLKEYLAWNPSLAAFKNSISIRSSSLNRPSTVTQIQTALEIYDDTFE